MKQKIKVALVDDHILLRAGLCSLIESFSNCEVLFEADNGKDFIRKFKKEASPDIVLMDINMPEMNGYETSAWIKDNHPEVKVLALLMHDHENEIVKMIRAGIKGYILKDSDPGQLKCAIDSIMNSGFHYTHMMTGKLINLLSKAQSEITLNDRELEFLRLACTELTYKEIADRMCKGTRTIDGYRDALFDKLQVKTRVGLVLYAIKNEIVCLN